MAGGCLLSVGVGTVDKQWAKGWNAAGSNRWEVQTSEWTSVLFTVDTYGQVL